MSLNELPNELIAHIGTFLNFEDNIQFSLSQKRIHAVLKRDGLDKPECKSLRFTNSFCYYALDEFVSSSIPYEKKKEEKYFSIQGEIIDKFRNIDLVVFEYLAITDEVLKDLRKTKKTYTLLWYLLFRPKLNLLLPKIPENFYCDNVFVELIPFASLNIFINTLMDGYSLTDCTLEALADPEEYCNFEINRVFVSFTIAGVKRLTEKLVHRNASKVKYELGILRFKEHRNLLLWMEEAAADLNCPYTISRNDSALDANEMFNYNISLNESGSATIRFAVNPIQV